MNLDTGESIALIALSLVVMVIGVYFRHLGDKRLSVIWRRVADECGLIFVTDYHLFGQIDGFSIAAFVYTEGSGKSERTFTRVTVRGDQMCTAVRIRGEGFLSSMFSSDFKVGDPSFDSVVKLDGDELTALALLHEDMRRFVRSAVGQGWILEDGVWILNVSGRLSDALRSRIETGVELARATNLRQADVPSRLAAIAHHDSALGSRKRALEHLVRYFDTDPSTRDVLDAACADSDPSIRLLAAAHLGNIEVLVDLAQNGNDVPQRLEAFDAMVRVAPHDGQVRSLVAQWLGFDDPDHRPLRQAAIDAAAQTNVPDIEARLLDALDADADDIKLSAIRALGALGTVAVVPALIPYRDKVFAFALKAAAKDAILAIQARVAGADAGALALAEEAGGLALSTEVESVI